MFRRFPIGKMRFTASLKQARSTGRHFASPHKSAPPKQPAIPRMLLAMKSGEV